MKPIPFLTVFLGVVLGISLSASAHEDERIPTGAPDRIGDVAFPVSCSPAAQEQFNRALAMLHSFFYPEAGKTFARVTEIDPSCAMGHWGVAMSWWYPLWYPPTREAFMQGKAAIEKAAAVGARTDRERAYIAALAMFYGDFDKLDHKSRSLAYERAMAGVYAELPRRPRGGDVLRARAPGDGQPERHDLRQPAQERRDPGKGVRRAAQSSRCGTLPHPCLRLSGVGAARAPRRAAVWRHRPGDAACAAHALPHLHRGRAVAGFDRIQPRGRRGGPPARVGAGRAAHDGLPGLRLSAGRAARCRQGRY